MSIGFTVSEQGFRFIIELAEKLSQLSINESR